MDGPDGEIFGVDIHFTVQDRGGNEPFGVEAECIGLPSVHLQGIHQEVVVEWMPRRTGR